jgi:hypothetical protein
MLGPFTKIFFLQNNVFYFNMILYPLIFQEYRSEKSLEALAKLVPPQCHW